MAMIPIAADPTLEAVDAAIVAAQDNMPRPYLGMSGVGNPCDRKNWYDFRWSTQRAFNAATIKRFDDGHRGEAVQAERLRLVAGVELHTLTPDGDQYGFVLCGGHCKGHMDGAIRGLLQAPKTWHVWEHKQVGETKFKKLASLKAQVGEKSALKEWDEVYFGQAQLYMRCSGMDRHYLTCATPGGRDTISVRTDADHAFADRLIERAQRIIDAPEPPARLSERPDWYECKLCDYQDICHWSDVPLPTCRSCAHVTPVQDGQWHCARHNALRSVAEQKDGCQGHRFIPVLLRNFADAVDADTEANSVTYKHRETGHEFINGLPPAGFESIEIHACADKKALGDPGVQALRTTFDGRVAE